MKKIYLQFLEFIQVNFYMHGVALSIGLTAMLIVALLFQDAHEYVENQKLYDAYRLGVFLFFYLFTLLMAFLPIHLKRRDMKDRGRKRPGIIVNVSISRFSCYLVWEYEYHGQIYRGGTSTFRDRMKWFRNGQSVLVTIDSENPKQSFLEELYR